MSHRPVASFLLAFALSGCGAGTDVAPSADPVLPPIDYANADAWMCHPAHASDPCRDAALATTTELLSDGSTRVIAPEAASAPAYDCFYLYPTVVLDGEPGNETRLDAQRDRVLDPLLRQAAPFAGQCRVFAPLYRQIRFPTYLRSTGVEAALERAYGDVEAAFRAYLAASDGDRPFVLLGHSQGTHLGRRLLERVVAPSAELRARLLVAILPGGDVLAHARDGSAANTGGIPLCAATDERSCVIAFRAFAADHPPPARVALTVIGGVPEGLEPACNFAPIAGERLVASRLATSARQNGWYVWHAARPPARTPFVLYRDFYEGRCIDGDGGGFPYLAVRASPGANDARRQRVRFDSEYFTPSILGLHVLDFDFVLGDLLAITEEKADAWRRERSDAGASP